ncbi:xanthine dehydrogenase small subunit [Microbacterium invictum]|uniref:FAD binding domain-containing protein n=1 Tax=Microbacterium invictum TaxID=515415 RepID=A0ABZ0VDF1_9MICO|nr:FAD binding domain-containing protein [Microbacterium invictum]WQB70550.1 FAD binding domain-containing protein [Microbacterium invictum]
MLVAEDRVDAGPVAAVTDDEVTVNGALRSLDGVPVHTNALDWLRSCGLTGSKEGCAEGECGACAMLILTPRADEGADVAGAAWTAVNSCLVPAQALRGQEIVTAEGLGTPEALHPVQEVMAAGGGSQCGYCTPGFVCSMAGEYYRRDRTPVGDERTPAGSERTLAGREGNGFDLHALSGNLCRCTGYRPIRDAAYELGMPDGDDPLAARLRHPAPDPSPTDVTVDGARFVRPETLDEALTLLASEPDARLVAGATDWGVDVNLRSVRAPLVVAIDRLPELRAFRADDAEIELGAALTLTEVAAALGDRVPLLSELLPQFASPLIRNRATLGGNLGTGSPIGDALPALLALGASVVLASRDAERDVPLEEYFTGYRQTVRRDDEIIRALRFPAPRGELAAFHKIAKRRFDDISSVAVAFVLDLRGGVVADARIGLGGVAATPLRARATEQALIGRDWSLATVREVAPVLGAEGTPMSDHRASAAYRAAMLENALRKLFARHPKPTARAVAR